MNVPEKLPHFIQGVFLLFIFLLPWQTRYVFHEGMLNGGYWEYGSMGVYIADIVFVIFVVGYLWLRRQYKIETKSKNLWDYLPLILVLWAFLSLVWAPSSGFALYYVLKLFEGVFLFYFIKTYPIRLDFVLFTFIGSAILQGMLSFSQAMTQHISASTLFGMALHEPWQQGVSVVEFAGGRMMRAYGSFPHPNLLGGFLVLCFFFLLSFSPRLQNKYHRLFITTASIFIATGIFFSFSRSAFVALLIGLVIFITSHWKTQKIFSWIPIVTMIITFAVFSSLYLDPILTRVQGTDRLEIQSTDKRVESFQEAFTLISERPFLGIGAGNYTLALSRIFPGRESYESQPVHNLFLLIFAELGIIGLGLVVAFLYHVFLVTPKSLRPIFVALIVLSMFDHYFWTLSTGIMIWWLVLGMSIVSIKKGD